MKRNSKLLTKGIIFILINTALWGISPYIIKKGLLIIPIFAFLLYRFIWVMLFKFLTSIKQINIKKFKQTLKKPGIIASAFLMNFGTLYFYFKGINLLTAVQAGVISALSPLFIVVPMLIIGKEKLDKKEILGLVLMFIAYGLLIAPSKGMGQALNLKGVLYITLGNIAYSIAVMINKHYINKFDETTYDFISYGFALAGFSILTYKTAPQFLNLIKNFSYFVSPYVLYMSIGASLIALYTLTQSLKYLEASEVASFAYLQPFFLTILEMCLHVIPIDTITIVAVFVMALGGLINIKGIYDE